MDDLGDKEERKSILVRLRKQDDWETPIDIWRQILPFLPAFPRKRTIWMPFFYNGKAKTHLSQLGHQVVHEQKDFFTTPPPPHCVVVDNPPFSKKRQVLERLFALDLPFALILPISTIATQYFHTMQQEKGSASFKVIIPSRRMRFDSSNFPPFACIWLLYKFDDWVETTNQLVFI